MWFIFSVQVFCCCSVSKSCLTLWSHGLRHTRLLCPAPADRVCSISRSLSCWCHNHQFNQLFLCHQLLLRPQSFPASGSFPVSWLFPSGDQSTGASASASVLPMNIQGWFPLGITGLISCCHRDSQESSPTPQFESISSSVLSMTVNNGFIF